MSKIKLKISMKSLDENFTKEIDGILNNNRIIYNDDGVKTTIILDNPLSLVRENDDYKFEFIFSDKPIGKYIIKLYNTYLDLNIDKKELILKDNKISLKYNLNIEEEDCGLFEYELEYKIIN